MPEITALGWFHTAIGIVALVTGLACFVRSGFITSTERAGQIYLAATLVTAATALGIYNQGGFGVAHLLAVLTLGALAVGGLAERTGLFGGFSPYLQAISYSATFLFHMIPAITDGLMRLPVGDPVVTSIEDPLLRGFYLAFLITYLAGAGFQVLTLRRQARASMA